MCAHGSCSLAEHHGGGDDAGDAFNISNKAQCTMRLYQDLLVAASLLQSVSGYFIARPIPTGRAVLGGSSQFKTSSCLSLVTEDDVLEAVEKAETLWAEALAARKTANTLSDRAEEEAEAAAETSQQVAEMYTNMKTISLEKVAEADAATKSSIDASSMVGDALDASDQADRLEDLAEEALKLSEQNLEQHLKDYPDSPLAD
jgi:hypothetical protein